MQRKYSPKQCITLSHRYEQYPREYFDADEYDCIFYHYFKTLQLDKALQVAKEAVAHHPNDVGVNNCLCRILLENPDSVSTAGHILSHSFELLQDPSLPQLIEKEDLYDLQAEAWELKGLYYLQLGENDKARKAFEKAAKYPQEEYPRDCDMAQIYIDRQQVEEALAFLKRGCEKAPKDKYVWQLLCDTCNKLHIYEEEINAYQHLLDLDPYSSDTWTDLAIAYANKGERTQAKEAFDYALNIDPKNATSWLFLGDFFTDEQNYTQALECYQQFYRLQPENHEILLTIAKCYRLMEKVELAKETFQAFLKIQPDSLDAQIGIAEILYTQHQPKEAIALFLQVLKKDPQKVEAMVYLGEIYHHFGNNDKAIYYFERIIKLQRNLEFILYLGNLYNEVRDFNSALYYYLEAESMDPTVENLELNIAIIYYELEEYSQTESHLVDACHLNPTAWNTFLSLYPNAQEHIHIPL